jgi:hypothetical protein
MSRPAPGVAPHRQNRLRRTEQRPVVEFGPVNENVRVRVGRHRQLALTDPLGDPRPRLPRQVEQRDSAVAKVVRRLAAVGVKASGKRPRRPAKASAPVPHKPRILRRVFPNRLVRR